LQKVPHCLPAAKTCTHMAALPPLQPLRELNMKHTPARQASSRKPAASVAEGPATQNCRCRSCLCAGSRCQYTTRPGCAGVSSRSRAQSPPRAAPRSASPWSLTMHCHALSPAPQRPLYAARSQRRSSPIATAPLLGSLTRARRRCGRPARSSRTRTRSPSCGAQGGKGSGRQRRARWAEAPRHARGQSGKPPSRRRSCRRR
jgi:hypothetical protein